MRLKHEIKMPNIPDEAEMNDDDLTIICDVCAMRFAKK